MNKANVELKEFEKKNPDIHIAYFMREAKEQLFDKYEELTNFKWCQYTPYFNDGDTCRFSANTEYVKINGWSSWDDNDDNVKEPTKELRKSVIAFLRKFDDTQLEHWFGDHVEITVSQDGISVDDYEHD